LATPTIDEILKIVHDSDGSVDIREHLSTLTEYAARCSSVTELGTRWVVSTWALMAGKPKVLNSFDIEHFSTYGVDPVVLKAVADSLNVSFNFYQEDVLTTDNIKKTDLLFIDTVHSYKQLSMELYLHGSKANKYIIFHDTVSFGEEDELEIPLNPQWSKELIAYYETLGPAKGINAAIVEFLVSNPEWRVEKMSNKNNGLMVLRRDQNAKS
jgi:hypothetical protein